MKLPENLSTKNNLFLLACLLVLFLCSLKTASAATYYVATSGNDSNPGTESQPWKTIQKAANTMVAGDTVYVKGGIYNEQVTPRNSGTPENYITYQVYPGDIVRIDGQKTISEGFAIGDKVYLILDGFEIGNQRYRPIHIVSSNHLIIRNNILTETLDLDGTDGGVKGGGQIHGIEAEGGNSYLEISYNEAFKNGGIWLDNTQYSDIHHNKVHDCPYNGIAMSHGSHYNKIYHNFVYNNGESLPDDPEWWAGIALEVNSNYNHIYDNIVYNNKHAGLLTNSKFNYFYHNTVYSNPDSSGWGGGIYLCNWEGSTIENNIVRNNIIVATGDDEKTIYVEEVEGRESSFDNNIYWHTGNKPTWYDLITWGPGAYITFPQFQSDYSQESNWLYADPIFVGGDPTDPSFYELQPDSPAIDAGADVGVVEDFDGNPRPQGAGYDIGAYEY